MRNEIEIAKEIFNRHYIDQLDKNLYPSHEALKLSIKEAEEKGLNKVKECLIKKF